jgi:hypothetical protein
MAKNRSLLVVSALALLPVALGGCQSVDLNNLESLFRITANATPTSSESKQHWDVVMAGIQAKSDGDAHAGLNLLSADARSMQFTNNDRDYMLERLQRVSRQVDNNDWTAAKDELQSLRWRYGRF